MQNTLTAALALGLILLAGAVVWLAYSIQGVTRELPAVMTRVDNVNARIDAIVEVIPHITGAIPPVVEEVGKVREAVPPILTEVEKVRQTVPGVLEEVAKIREAMPSILARVDAVQKQVEELEKALPMVAESLSNAADAVHHAADEVEVTRPLVEKVITESRFIREEIPGTLDRVETIVENARQIGSKATEGAVTGAVKGIITSPFKLLKDAGKSIAGSLFSTREITVEDERRVVEATTLLLQNLELNSVVWANPRSGNRGRITIQRAYKRHGTSCIALRFDLTLRSGKKESSLEEVCLAEDGSWQIR